MLDTGLTDAVVLVTGGAGGIGAAVSHAFAAQGSRVAVHRHAGSSGSPEGVRWEHTFPERHSAEDLAETLGDAMAVTADLTEDGSAARLFDEVESELGPVDVLINNAAHCESPDSYDALSGDGLSRHYRVNAIAPALLIAELANRRAERGGCVVNISTDAARAFPGQVGYGSSKAALEALTRGAALDLGPQGLRVNAVAPGPVQTGWMSDEVVETVREMIPLGRVGTPEDVADACVFLASRQARWITGQIIQVAGGHSL